MSKSIVVTEGKHSVSLHIEDAGLMKRETIVFTLSEWGDLLRKAEKTRSNPLVQKAMSKAEHPSNHSVVKRIQLVDPE